MQKSKKSKIELCPFCNKFLIPENNDEPLYIHKPKCDVQKNGNTVTFWFNVLVSYTITGSVSRTVIVTSANPVVFTEQMNSFGDDNIASAPSGTIKFHQKMPSRKLAYPEKYEEENQMVIPIYQTSAALGPIFDFEKANDLCYEWNKRSRGEKPRRSYGKFLAAREGLDYRKTKKQRVFFTSNQENNTEKKRGGPKKGKKKREKKKPVQAVKGSRKKK